MSSLDPYEAAIASVQRFFRAINDPSFTQDKLPELVEELVSEDKRRLERARRILAEILYRDEINEQGVVSSRKLAIAPFIDSIATHPSLTAEGLRQALVTRPKQDMPLPHSAHSAHIVSETRAASSSHPVKSRHVSSRLSQPYPTSNSRVNLSRREGLLRGILHATEELHNTTHNDANIGGIEKRASDMGEQHPTKTPGGVHERSIGHRHHFLLGDRRPEPAVTRPVSSTTRTTEPEASRDDRRDIINLVGFSPLGFSALGESSSGAPPPMSPGVPPPSIHRVQSRPAPPGYSNYQVLHNSQVLHGHMHIKREPQELRGMPSAPINLDVTRSPREALPRGPLSQPQAGPSHSLVPVRTASGMEPLWHVAGTRSNVDRQSHAFGA
ncbi:hypothetical protein FRC11_003912, partial [Ceratobasidium sp. 423]